MSDRRSTVEIVGDGSRAAASFGRAGKSLREKLEGPRALREVIEKAWCIVRYADEHPAIDPGVAAAIEEVRAALERLDEIRTGA